MHPHVWTQLHAEKFDGGSFALKPEPDIEEVLSDMNGGPQKKKGPHAEEDEEPEEEGEEQDDDEEPGPSKRARLEGREAGTGEAEEEGDREMEEEG